MTDTLIHHKILLDETFANERLDATLSRLLPQYSRSVIQGWIKAEQVLVDAMPVKPNYKILGKEEVVINASPRKALTSEPQNIPLTIVHEEDDFLIINKPVGLVVHPGAGNANSTLLNALLHHAPSLSTLPRAGILHRLDKDTSGLLLVAKTDAALQNLSLQLKNREIAREYKTVVYGNMISGGKVDAPIGRHPTDRKRMKINGSGKPAVTHYRIAERFKNHTLLRVKLETGRTHQIRVHMTHIHHPIIGDRTYGGRVKLGKGMTETLIETIRSFKRQALHAFSLGFAHPISAEPLTFECDLPADIAALLEALRKDAKESDAK